MNIFSSCFQALPRNVGDINRHMRSLASPSCSKLGCSLMTVPLMLYFFLSSFFFLFFSVCSDWLAKLQKKFALGPWWWVNKSFLGPFKFPLQGHMGVSKNNGTPQIIHFNRGFPLFSPSILGFFPLFLGWHPYRSIQHHHPLGSRKLKLSFGLPGQKPAWQWKLKDGSRVTFFPKASLMLGFSLMCQKGVGAIRGCGRCWCEDVAVWGCCGDAAVWGCCGDAAVWGWLLRDTLLRTLLCEDVAARYAAADASVWGCCCAIRCCARCCVRMLLHDALLRTLLCEDVAARYAAADAAVWVYVAARYAADAAVWGCCCAIRCGRCCVRMLLRNTLLRTLLCEDVAARYTAADAAVWGCCCAIRCCGRCCVRMLLRDTLLRTLLGSLLVWGCCCAITCCGRCCVRMLLHDTRMRALLCGCCCAIRCCGRCCVRMLLRDTPLRTLLCEDVAARYAAVWGWCCAILCCGRCCARMLLRDTLLRTLLCEDFAARYAAVWECCCTIRCCGRCCVRMWGWCCGRCCVRMLLRA